MMTNESIRFYPHDRIFAKTIIPLIPRRVRPNHITVFRFIAAPFVFAVLLLENYAVGVPFFFLVALTDAIDGSLARLRKQITVWGTIADPVADKILIGGVFLLIVIRHINIYLALAVILLEVIALLGGWWRTKKKGEIPAATAFGKTKMVFQCAGVLSLLVALWAGIDLFKAISVGSFSISIIFALLSFVAIGISF